MNTINKSLLNLTAADIMSDSLVVVPEQMSLQGAARMLAQAEVTGAPVIDGQGRCVGVLSATDFVHWMSREHHGPAACATSPAFCASWTMVEPDSLADETVGDCMTRDPVMVRSTASLGELARKMIDAHIHRVIVIDPQGRPTGIVSSMDVISAVAAADQKQSAVANTPRAGKLVSC